MGNKERRAHPRQDLETPAEITVAKDADQKDKREHERVTVAYEINIEAGLRIGGQEVMRLKIVGTTIDISRGGMLIKVDQDVIPGARCEVRFPEANGVIEPDRTSGRVRRSRAAREHFQLAVQFDEPLKLLKGDD
ncbi:MAG: PilZ domain-containing protein [Acidobacteriota bacterium]|jgi:hypothetical protein